MFEVLIVDDEGWVVESLKKGISWEQHGFRVIDQAYDGAEALDKIRNKVPDLVFTDIRMPEMGGLDLIRQVRKEKLPVEFVVVSGYAEFAYAQKAMQYGVLGFCLKPAEDDEVNSVLNRVKALLDSRRNRNEDAAEEMVGVAEGRTDDLFAERLSRVGFDWDDESGKYLLAHRGRADVLKLKGAPIYTTLIGLNYRIWVIGGDFFARKADSLRQLLEYQDTLVGASRLFRQRRDIDSAVQEAIVACNHRFIAGRPGLFLYPRQADTVELREHLKELEQVIGTVDRFRITASFRAVGDLFASGNYTVKHASFLYNAVHYMIAARGFEDSEPVYHFEELLGVYPDFAYMIEVLEETTVSNCKPTLGRNEQHNPKAVDKAIDYVNRNLFEDISLKALAKQFYISPSHLCRSFKKVTGEPLTQHITRKRIEYAGKLLEDKDLSVSAVAEMSGYENYFYFARVFKRITGKTPTDYRNGTY